MEFKHETDRIFATDVNGKVIAEVTFPTIDGTVVINHTFVDNSLRGQGIAGKLLTAAAEQLRADGIKAKATCSYAVKWFSEHPEYSDIL